MPHTWPLEKLEKLTPKELVSLEINARERDNPGLGDLCFQVRVGRLKGAAKNKALGMFNFENKVANYLGGVATELNQKFDLSIETAAKVKTTNPHKLTDSRGDAKTGRSTKNGKFSMNRFISYKLGKTTLETTAVLRTGDSIDRAIYFVRGTPDIVPDGTYRDDLGLAADELATTFPTLEDAAAEYGKLLATFAPKRK